MSIYINSDLLPLSVTIGNLFLLRSKSFDVVVLVQGRHSGELVKN